MDNSLNIKNITFTDIQGKNGCRFTVDIPENLTASKSVSLGSNPLHAKAITRGFAVRQYIKALESDIVPNGHTTFKNRYIHTSDTFQTTNLKVASHLLLLFTEAGVQTVSHISVTAKKLEANEFPALPRTYADFIKGLNDFINAKLNCA